MLPLRTRNCQVLHRNVSVGVPKCCSSILGVDLRQGYISETSTCTSHIRRETGKIQVAVAKNIYVPRVLAKVFQQMSATRCCASDTCTNILTHSRGNCLNNSAMPAMPRTEAWSCTGFAPLSSCESDFCGLVCGSIRRCILSQIFSTTTRGRQYGLILQAAPIMAGFGKHVPERKTCPLDGPPKKAPKT